MIAIVRLICVNVTRGFSTPHKVMNQAQHEDRERPLFQAGALQLHAASRAFTLAHLSDPSLDLPHWLQQVETAIAVREGGMRIFEDERGYIHSFFSWRIDERHHERVLLISHLVLAQLGGRALQESVLTEVRALAEATHAERIEIESTHRGPALRPDLIRQFGFSGCETAGYRALV